LESNKIILVVFFFFLLLSKYRKWPNGDVAQAKQHPPKNETGRLRNPLLSENALLVVDADLNIVFYCQNKFSFLIFFVIVMSSSEARSEVAAATTASTVVGRDWLLKALDPINGKTSVYGMPTSNSGEVVIMNYTSSYDVGPPVYYGADATKDSFDSDVYLFQHPILFGVSHSGKTGTKRVTGDTLLTFSYYPGSSVVDVTLPIGYEPWTSKLYLNSQAAGVMPTGSITNLSDVCDNWAAQSQTYKMIYGGAQCIPTCSAMFNQGSFRVTQQVFHPDSSQAAGGFGYSFNPSSGEDGATRLMTAIDRGGVNAPSREVETFSREDYPLVENCLSNPRSMTCRFSEGLMVPYRLQNVMDLKSQSSERRVLKGYRDGSTYNIYGIVNADGVSFNYNANERIWQGSYVNASDPVIFLQCMGNDGYPFLIKVNFINTSGGRDQQTISTKVHPTAGSPKTQLVYSPNSDPIVNEYYFYEGQSSKFQSYAASPVIVGTDSTAGWAAGVAVPGTPTRRFPIAFFAIGQYYNYVNKTTVQPADYRYSAADCAILPFRSDGTENMTTVFIRSISYTASMQLVIRCGYELKVTAGSNLSPFKQLCPAYDRQALQGYIRASRAMRDAFSGFYSTDEGSQQYLAFLSSLLARVAQEDNALIQFGNMGGTVDQSKRKRR
jgi:hypothetical protein